MKLEQKVMNVGTRPDFGVRAEHMQMFGMPNQWSLMGMMTIPIVPWSSKMYSSEVKSMGLQIQSMELEKILFSRSNFSVIYIYRSAGEVVYNHTFTASAVILEGSV